MRRSVLRCSARRNNGLAAVQVGFRNGSNMAFQLLLSRKIDAVSIIRDFMLAGERSMAPTPQTILDGPSRSWDRDGTA